MPYAVVEDVTCEPIHSQYQTDNQANEYSKTHPIPALLFVIKLGWGCNDRRGKNF